MRQTARALLINTNKQCYLALHNHILPENKNKWGTVGGARDPSDASIRDCLLRELHEEFGESAPGTFTIMEEIVVIEKYQTAHHFFKVMTHLHQLSPAQPEEIIEAHFFTLEEVVALREQGKLYFDCEDSLFKKVLSN